MVSASCGFIDDVPCDVAPVGSVAAGSYQGTRACARHAFILSLTLQLYDQDAGSVALKDEAMAYEIAGSL